MINLCFLYILPPIFMSCKTNMASAKSNLNIQINSYEGDPSLLNFFFKQVRDYAKINKLKSDETAAVLRSKLTGPALKFLTEIPDLCNSDDIDRIEAEFKEFFAPVNKAQALAEMNNLIMRPQESVKNFAHRLDTLFTTGFPGVKDPLAVNEMKLNKFLFALPAKFRIKIQEENINEYKKAVVRAQRLQEIEVNEKFVDHPAASANVTTISDQLVNLVAEKINALTFKSEPKEKNETPQKKESHPRLTRDNYQTNFKTRHWRNKNYGNRFQYKRPVVRCQLCQAKNHSALNCARWKRVNCQRDIDYHNPNQNNNRRYDNITRRYNDSRSNNNLN